MKHIKFLYPLSFSLSFLASHASAAPTAPVAISQTTYFESCPSGQTVGGIRDARTSRIAIIPIYISYDAVDTNTYYSMKQNTNGAFDVFYTVKSATGIIPYPNATKELAAKYGQYQSDSVEECKPVKIEIPETQPPQFAWIEDGYETCPNGYTVGGRESGLTERHGTVEVWNTYDYYFGEIDYFKSASSGELSQFSYSELVGYEAPKWNIGKSIIDRFGVWNENSRQECSKTRTFEIKNETKSENCLANQTGVITSSREYKLWSDGASDSFSGWKVTSNTCETISVTPPVVTPVEPPVVTPPVVVPPIVTPPVVVPDEPEFVLVEEYQTSNAVCETGQTGFKTYSELWTYEQNKDGSKTNLKYVSKTLSSNTCKDIADNIIETKDGTIEEKCPSGQSGSVQIFGQYVTYALSGKKFVESKRINNCKSDKSGFEPEFKDEACPNAASGKITLVRYKSTKEDGSVSYSDNGAYTVFENNCQSLSDSEISESIVSSKAKGILANQTVKVSDTYQVKTMIAYIKSASSEVNTYKLNIVIDSIKYDAKAISDLAELWITKTGGKVKISSLPQSKTSYENILEKNTNTTLLRNAKYNSNTGNIEINYSQQDKILSEPKIQHKEIPLILVSQNPSVLKQVSY